MKDFWQRFLGSAGNDPELAGMSLLLVVCGVLLSGGVFVWLLIAEHSIHAVSLAAGVTVVGGICVRDYRRGKWSYVSRLLAAVWWGLTIAALGYAYWSSQ